MTTEEMYKEWVNVNIGQSGGSGLRLNDGFVVKLEIVGISLMIVFGWTLRGLTDGWFSLALARSVGILAMRPLQCFIIVF